MKKLAAFIEKRQIPRSARLDKSRSSWKSDRQGDQPASNAI